MLSYSIVFFGAGLGGAMRHGANVLALQHFGPGVGYGTVLVNILGSLLMGFVVAYLALIGESSQHLRLFLTTGVLGGFTTFSAFSLDAILLMERGAFGAAALYIGGTLVGSLAALFLALLIVRHLL